MRRTTFGWHLVSALALSAPVAALPAQDPQVATVAAERWTNEELDNLLAPIALYPDPILAQVLVAATYPDQVLAAQAHVRVFGTESIDQMPWEISVKAVARYEPVLNLLAEGEDWMTALGQAYATQGTDVMDAVQRLRQMANAQGNLQTTTQQQVVVEREVIRIVPAEPRVIYVPTYDPAVIYHRPVYVTHAHPAYWSWGVAYPIGVWLTYDVDWWGHRVYYHGWHTHGPRWVVVARPWIVINPIYIAPRHTVIVVNRGIVHRRWDTRVVRRYSVVHRNTTFDRHDRGFRRDDRDGRGRGVAAGPRGNNGNNGNSGNNAGNGNNGRRVGPPDSDQRGTGGRRVGPREDANGNRVVPLPSGGAGRVARGDTPRTNTPRANTPRRDVTPTATSARPATTRGSTANPASTPRAATSESARSSNGTWNPRPARERAVPAPTTSSPR
ncbi:MAG TPA: DUF3300 domain-containing protein, partial [Gemmatimonadaceae bacterium]|nr:DUF3300 domain-containing protein [Gemmatimonadaceae bacterium]